MTQIELKHSTSC